MEPAKKSKILIIGATGYIGKYLAEGSLRLGHPTFILVRQSTVDTNPEKAKLIKDFQVAGVTVLYGDLRDHESLVKAIKQVDVVFSAMGHEHPEQLASQINIVSAIKEAGNVKRYFPSEYGFDVDRVQLLEPAKSVLAKKVKIREAIRMAGIPHTFISSNLCATYFLCRLGQVEGEGPPKDEVSIIGDGNTKVILVGEQDIATYAIKAAEDPRTLNKVLYVRPPANICSQNELVTLWEKKTNKTLKRIYLSEEEVLKKIQDTPHKVSFIYAIAHAGFIKGEMTNFEIDPSVGIEASNLYSEVKYITVDECLEKFI